MGQQSESTDQHSSSSFVIFLVIIGVVIAFAAYTITWNYFHNSPEVLSSSTISPSGRWSEFGTYIGGTVGTLLAAATVAFTVIGIYRQYKNNLRQKFDDRFYQMLSIHNDNVQQMKLKDYQGREIFVRMFIEFCVIYKEVFKHFNIPMKKEEIEDSKNLNELFDKKIYYSLVFSNYVFTFGIGEFSYETLYSYVEKEILGNIESTSEECCKSIKKRRDSLRKLVFHCVNKGLKNIVNTMRNEIYKVGNKNFTNSHSCNSNNVSGNGEEIENSELNKRVNSECSTSYFNLKYVACQGHVSRLGHYYRNLYQIIKMIDNEELLNEYEKNEYAKIVRAQLSTHEQALLLLNSLSPLGKDWWNKKNVKNSYIVKYRMVSNIPEKFFDIFGVDFTKLKVYKLQLSNYECSDGKKYFEWQQMSSSDRLEIEEPSDAILSNLEG